MYTLRYIGIPQPCDCPGVWALLQECDRDFVPPLSQRNSTSQAQLTGLAAPEHALPYAYFEEIKTQHLIAAYDENGRMAAFMSFKTEYTCRELAAFGPMIYASTACVHHEDRGHGLLKAMYTLLEEQLPEQIPGDTIGMRTWSTNAAQIHELAKRGYREVARLTDDRGPGIDTVYYARRRIRPPKEANV